MDELSKRSNNLEIGCQIGDMKVNHVMYADDLTLLSPSTKGLQKPINTCVDYGIEHDIIYNVKKSVIMKFLSRDLRHITVPQFTMNGLFLSVKL